MIIHSRASSYLLLARYLRMGRWVRHDIVRIQPRDTYDVEQQIGNDHHAGCEQDEARVSSARPLQHQERPQQKEPLGGNERPCAMLPEKREERIGLVCSIA